jgi:hypothetical protein
VVEAGEPMIVAGETVAGAEVAGATVVGDAGEVEAADPLAVNDDEFPGSALDGDWTIYEPGLSSAQIVVSGGELNLAANMGGVGFSFWYMTNEGILVYKEITGDFDMVAGVRVRNYADSGLPTVGDGNYRVAGIAAHDPTRTDPNTDLNYVHVGLGCMNTADIEVEYKNTVDSFSDFTATPTSGSNTGVGELRLRRVGQIFTLFYRHTTGDSWTQVGEYDRTAAPMPSTLQVGFMSYSNEGVAEGGDIRLFVDYVHFTTP